MSARTVLKFFSSRIYPARALRRSAGQADEARDQARGMTPSRRFAARLISPGGINPATQQELFRTACFCIGRASLGPSRAPSVVTIDAERELASRARLYLRD